MDEPTKESPKTTPVESKQGWFDQPAIGTGLLLLLIGAAVTKGCDMFMERKESFDVEAVYGPYQEPTTNESESPYNGFAQFTIVNVGSSPAKQVQFQWQQEGFALIESMDKERTTQQFANLLDLGDLAVGESVTVSIWTSTRLPLRSVPLAALSAESGRRHVIEGIPADDPDAFWSFFRFGILVGVGLAMLAAKLLDKVFFSKLRAYNAELDKRNEVWRKSMDDLRAQLGVTTETGEHDEA